MGGGTDASDRQNPFTVTHPRSHAFTLIEIAISLGVIAFALVAIIGVLPLAMNVQKENRQETIINQDATIFLDLIRNGGIGADYLTNYVFGITNFVSQYAGSGPVRTHVYGYGPEGSSFDGAAMNPQFPLTNGAHIIGLLTTPRYTNGPSTERIYTSNYVVAYVRSMSGPASEKFPQSNQDIRDLTFSYRMICEICPYAYFERDWTNFTAYTNATFPASEWQWRSNRWMLSRNYVENSFDVRLVFRWPLFPNGDTGPKRQVFRTVVSGMLLRTNDPNYTITNLYFLQPRNYVKAP